MLYRTGYFLRETWINIRSNLTISVAAVVTIAVTSALVGAAFLARDATDNATARWEDGVEFIVFVEPRSSVAQIESLALTLTQHPDIDSFTYTNQEQAYEEFQELFPDQPEIVDQIGPADLPSSFSVVPRSADANLIDSLLDQFRAEPGVYEVNAAKDTIDALNQVFSLFRFSLFVLAVFLSIGAVLVIYNGIRVAMVARRRELEVQKLVGATNWFIRLPFLLEGVVHGLVGAALGSTVLWVARERFEEAFQDNQLGLFSGFIVQDGQLQRVILLMLLGGIALGAIGSFSAAGRYLDV